MGVPTVITTKLLFRTASLVSVVMLRFPEASALFSRISISWEASLRIFTLCSCIVSRTDPSTSSAFRMQLGQKVSRPTFRMRTPQFGQVWARTFDEGKRFLLCSTMGERPVRSSLRNRSSLSHPITFAPMSASDRARGRPTWPMPTMLTVIFPPVIPLVMRRGVASSMFIIFNLAHSGRRKGRNHQIKTVGFPRLFHEETADYRPVIRYEKRTCTDIVSGAGQRGVKPPEDKRDREQAHRSHDHR